MEFTWDDDNRRIADRVEVTWSVDCETEETFLYACITNISAMGIFVQTLEPLPIGTVITLRFAPQRSPNAFVLRGAVQWINEAVEGVINPGMGVQFIELSLDDRERIVDAIKTIAYLREEPTPLN